MTKIPPSPLARARGALLGLAAGSAAAGTAATGGEGRGADLELALLLAEELLAPDVDLERLAGRWIEWRRRDGRGLDPTTAAALRHLEVHHSPPASGGHEGGAAAVAHCLPIALAAARSPRNLVSGTFHTAALTHPDPRSAWGAVAVNVTAARFLQGRRDFVPDVVEGLRNNQAPEELLAAVRRVPLVRREEAPAAGAADAVHCVATALWCAHHEPSLERAVARLVETGTAPATVAATAALLGARDGEGAIPPRWLAAVGERDRIVHLAEALTGGR